tara:strand:+ start:377 stop:505 length:129 start_codon:yes stop_codon:yes gene_type:complete
MLSFLTGLVLVLAGIWFAIQILGFIAGIVIVKKFSKELDSNE